MASADKTGGCCCGGGSTDCCPSGDPPDTLCLTFSADGWTANADGGGPGPETFAGKAFEFTRRPAEDGTCVWASEPLAVYWTNPTTGDDYGPAVPTDFGINSFRITFSSGGRATIAGTANAYFHNNAFAGFVTANISGTADLPTPGVAGCLPQTFTPVGYSWVSPGGVPVSPTTTATATLTAGPCPAMGVTPALAATSAPAPAVAPCRFEGSELTGMARRLAGLDHRRRWYKCGLPGFARFGLPVTDCQSCGVSPERRCGPRTCPGYMAAE
jgi:hypothetical protein